jgi:predicted RNA-binding protein YlxR (DUF448 family)
MPAKTAARPRHIPRRTCVGCGTVAAKRDLVRVVRTVEGAVERDSSGKKAGRGAYLCLNPTCWDQAVKRGRLERSLKAKLSPSDIDSLRAFAQTLGLTAGGTE